MPRDNGEERRGKWRLFRIVIVRIIVLAAVVIGYALPLPWKIIVPMTIGTVTIIIEAYTYFKTPSGHKEKINAEQKQAKRSKTYYKANGKAGGHADQKADSKKAARKAGSRTNKER